MDQYNSTHYLMCMKSKNLITNAKNFPTSMNSFNEPLGGFIWPQRSYNCNFCGRDFRSAQALGGHMNVHRRDRAKLKQSSSSHQQAQVIAKNINHRQYDDKMKGFVGRNLVDDGTVICKRHKKSASMEDIDLELRLGDPPTVK